VKIDFDEAGVDIGIPNTIDSKKKDEIGQKKAKPFEKSNFAKKPKAFAF
jgi:hypothetical protein